MSAGGRRAAGWRRLSTSSSASPQAIHRSEAAAWARSSCSMAAAICNSRSNSSTEIIAGCLVFGTTSSVPGHQWLCDHLLLELYAMARSIHSDFCSGACQIAQQIGGISLLQCAACRCLQRTAIRCILAAGHAPWMCSTLTDELHRMVHGVNGQHNAGGRRMVRGIGDASPVLDCWWRHSTTAARSAWRVTPR